MAIVIRIESGLYSLIIVLGLLGPRVVDRKESLGGACVSVQYNSVPTLPSFCSRIPSSFTLSTQVSFHNAKMALRYLSRQHFFKLPHTFHSSQIPIFQRTNNQAIRCLSSSQTRHKMATDYSQLPTPAKCYVDFCLVPVSYLESCNYLTYHLLVPPSGYYPIPR